MRRESEPEGLSRGFEQGKRRNDAAMRLFYIPRYSVSLFLAAGPAPTFDGVRQIFQVLEFKMQELSELIES